MKYLPVTLKKLKLFQNILFLNFLRILNRLEVAVFDRVVKLESPCIVNQAIKTHRL
jgi:hypothetical protein